ncbi:MAG: CotH kinase family protein [Verrucomicrobiota bacterium]
MTTSFSAAALTGLFSGTLAANGSEPGLLFYQADFEAPAFAPGNIDGQRGWSLEQGRAEIRDGAGRNGSAGLVLEPLESFSQATMLLETALPPQATPFLDFHVLPVATDEERREEMLDLDGARIGFFRTPENPGEARFWIFHGNGTGGGQWVATEVAMSVDSVTGRSAEWARLTLRENFEGQSWDLWVNGHLTADTAGFQDPVLRHTRSYVIMGDAVDQLALDDLTFGGDNPLGADEDADGMLDADERRIGSNPVLPDRGGADDSGKTFREKWWRLLSGHEPPSKGNPLPLPVFSRPSAVIREVFDLTISSPDHAKVYYTTDGSTPTPSTGLVFTGPIQITGTTVIRACVEDERGNISGIAAAAWVFPEDVAGQRLPPGWPDSLSEPDLNAARLFPLNPQLLTDDIPLSPLPSPQDVADALEKAPVVVLALPLETLFGDYGLYEKSLSIPSVKGIGDVVWMDTGGHRPGGAAQATVSVSGQSSRSHTTTLKHSLRLTWTAAAEAGAVFGEDRFPCRQFLLRHPTQDSWAVTGNFSSRRTVARYVTDAWASQWLAEQGHVSPKHRWVHVFLNNTYWGVYEAVEQHDTEYVVRHPEAGAERHLVEPGETGPVRAIAGDAGGWVRTLQRLRLLSARGESAPDEEWEKGAADVDQAGLIDYILWNWWLANHDWPTRNWTISQEGGQWRFLSWDTEMAMPADPVKAAGTPARLATDSGGPAAAFTALSRWTKFRQTVAGRFEELTDSGNGALSEARLLKSLERQVSAFGPLAAAESARWGGVYSSPPLTPGDWRTRIDWVRERFIPGRSETVRAELETWLANRAAEALRVPNEPSEEPQAAAVVESPVLLDSDGDGIPDIWELRFGLDPFNSDDSPQDLDGDGMSNLDEFMRKSNPRIKTILEPLDENSPGVISKFQEHGKRARNTGSTEPVKPETKTEEAPEMDTPPQSPEKP